MASGIKITTKRINPGWVKKLAKNIKGLDGKEVAVGFPRGEKASSLTYDNGFSVLENAMAQQFGVPNHIPARPFMDVATERIIEDAKNEMGAVAKQANRREINADQALHRIGLYGEKCIQEAITDGEFVPNAPSTVKAKKSNKPLIDTGKMRQSVASVVRIKTE